MNAVMVENEAISTRNVLSTPCCRVFIVAGEGTSSQVLVLLSDWYSAFYYYHKFFGLVLCIGSPIE